MSPEKINTILLIGIAGVYGLLYFIARLLTRILHELKQIRQGRDYEKERYEEGMAVIRNRFAESITDEDRKSVETDNPA